MLQTKIAHNTGCSQNRTLIVEKTNDTGCVWDTMLYGKNAYKNNNNNNNNNNNSSVGALVSAEEETSSNIKSLTSVQ
jgi:hypothetical protein